MNAMQSLYLDRFTVMTPICFNLEDGLKIVDLYGTVKFPYTCMTILNGKSISKAYHFKDESYIVKHICLFGPEMCYLK